MKTKRIYLQNQKSLHFSFNQNRYDFIVNEIPLREFSNKGNYLILKIKKVFTSTWELINMISTKLDIDENQIGYAGLKDKNATTTQYISIPLNKSRDYKLINNKYIEVLETFVDDKKIKIGDLHSNRFKITLKDIKSEDITTLYQRISQIQKHGLPNYFGFQRFGKENNFEKSKAIVYGEEVHSDKKLESFMKIAYQSYFFNAWLAKRVELSNEQNSKKLLGLDGDILSLLDKKTITGLMPGRNIIRAKSEARKLEEKFDDIFIHEKGSRRDATIVPQNIKNKIISNSEDPLKNMMELEFSLPKSSYATVFIESLSNKNYGY